MPTPSSCVPVCPDLTTTNSAGPAGAAGVAGQDGIDAYCFLLDDIVIPQTGGLVYADVSNSYWMAVGQYVIISNISGDPPSGTAAHFIVRGIQDIRTVVLEAKIIAGYNLPGEILTSGSKVSPSGSQSACFSLNISNASGTPGRIETVAQIIDFGTTDTQIVIPVTGTYFLSGSAIVTGYDGIIFVANATFGLYLTRTNNIPYAPLEIPNAYAGYALFGATNYTNKSFTISIPPIVYAGTKGDIIEMWGVLFNTPTTGYLAATQAQITAMRYIPA